MDEAGEKALRTTHGSPQVAQSSRSEARDGHSRRPVLDSFLFRGHPGDKHLLIGMFSHILNIWTDLLQRPLCAAGQWAANKTAPEPAELGAAERERVSEGAVRTGVGGTARKTGARARSARGVPGGVRQCTTASSYLNASWVLGARLRALSSLRKRKT